ncbi:MAG: chromosomal replication initiator protein DnaA [Bacteroidales bacterium]|jgi:chromosomal replication initiator protein|nr:chromosomal replication initiator protein DnaA [Bacteroidales bacterium]
MKDLQIVWGKCLEKFRDNIHENSYKQWFEPIIPISLIQDGRGIYTLTIEVPSHFYYEFIEERFSDIMEKTLNSVIAPFTRLEYSIQIINNENGQSIKTTVPQNFKTENNRPINIPIDESKPKNPYIIPGLDKYQIHSYLNANLNFENLVEGECNRLGRSVGLAITQSPGNNSYNPFFIFGKSGYGKTHLLHAIGNQTKKIFPAKNVLYLDTKKFETSFTDHVKNNCRNDFMNFFQLIDVLIMDDIQFLSSKDKTQEAFFHIFNQLQTQQKQIIISCDKNLKEIEGLDERLVSRFRWGITAELGQPEYNTRLEIIKQQAKKDGLTNEMELEESIYEFIAANATNPREMLGVLNSILATANLEHKKITLDIAKEITQKIIKNSEKNITIDYIFNYVANYLIISPEAIKGNSRKKEVVTARHIIMYFAKKYTKLSLQEIGFLIGNKDHATVIHAQKKITDHMETDKQFKKDIETIEKKFIS